MSASSHAPAYGGFVGSVSHVAEKASHTSPACEPARFENCGPGETIEPDGSLIVSLSVALP